MRRPLLSDLAPDRVLLLGDSHGNAAFVEYAVQHAKYNGCNVVVQLGDFGYWEHTAAGRAFVDRVQRAAVQHDVTFLFVDGNHENHDLLDELAEQQRGGRDGVVWARDSIGWLTRGTRWTWHDRTFAALGGAASIDRPRRNLGWSWWPQEVLSETDLHTLGTDPVDVLIAHDAPSSAHMVGTSTVEPGDLERCAASRSVLDRAIQRTRPQLVIHGHWHLRHSRAVAGYTIEGFGCDADAFAQSVGVLDVVACAVRPAVLDPDALDPVASLRS